jgi:hypothetical protein
MFLSLNMAGAGEPVAQLDWGRIPVSRGMESLQRPRQVNGVVMPLESS